MTDYLSLAQARAPRGTEEQDNPYLPLAQQQQNLQQNRARTVLESALRDDPDLAAERLRVSQTSGVPLRVVERNLDELRVKERARAIDLVSMAQDSPVLYRQITDPTFATTSVDDLGTLKNLERSIGKGVRYAMGADGKGGLPSEGSFIGLEDDGVVLEAVKPAEDGNGIIIRFYESHGEMTGATISCECGLASVSECNFMEEYQKDVPFSEVVIDVALKPFEIKTLRLVPA